MLKKLAEGDEGRIEVGRCRKDLSKEESAPWERGVDSPEMERRLEERL